MLFEQSFLALPEFLTGAPFREFRFEGTVLAAFAMAVLQELNGRNVNNPISALRSEVHYPCSHTKHADLHINLESLGVFTDTLKEYGFYKDNWLEGKYLRLNEHNKPTVDKLKVVLLLAKDLLRLTALPPETNPPASSSGRYLLHAYQGDPKWYTASKKNSKANGPKGFTRNWIERIRLPGRQVLDTFRFNEEVSQFDTIIGKDLRSLILKLTVTNFVQSPRTHNENSYFLVLTRIDDFRIENGDDWVERKAGSITESASGIKCIATKVEKYLAK